MFYIVRETKLCLRRQKINVYIKCYKIRNICIIYKHKYGVQKVEQNMFTEIIYDTLGYQQNTQLYNALL